MEPTPHTRDERLARELRAQIYAGQPPVGSSLESAAAIAARRGDMSAAMVQRAFNILRREGLVQSEQGRGTYVSERYQWTARVGGTFAGRVIGRLVGNAERAEPAVTGLAVTVEGDVAWWTVTVEAADLVPAVMAAVNAARLAGATGRVSVEVHPA